MDKTVQMHAKRINQGRFTKSEIGALTKLFSASRFHSTPESRKLGLEQLRKACFRKTPDASFTIERFGHYFVAEPLYFKKPCRITAEQTKLGKAWLMSRYIKKNGEYRKAAQRELNYRQGAIVRKVSRFEFVGLLFCTNHQSGDLNDVLPIYRTFDRTGRYFDYAPVHWGTPVIMEAAYVGKLKAVSNE